MRGHHAACGWILRHASDFQVFWERPTFLSSRAAAETVVTLLRIGGAECWATATKLYAGALATRSVGRRGAVAWRGRLVAIYFILSALAEPAATGAPRGKLARRLARDITPPCGGASDEEQEVMASVCVAALKLLLLTGEFGAAQRCVRRWVVAARLPVAARLVVRTLLVEAAGGESDGGADNTHSMRCREALLRGGFLDHIEAVTGLAALQALLFMRSAGVADRCIVRWCVDAAMYMNQDVWSVCFVRVLPTDISSELFYKELLLYFCTQRRLSLPSFVVDRLPDAVLCDKLADVMSCCREKLDAVGLQRLQSAISTVVGSELVDKKKDGLLCLELFFELLGSDDDIKKDTRWWRNALQRCAPFSVKSAIVWTNLCISAGVEELILQPLPCISSCFSVLVLQASYSASAAKTLFAAVRQSGQNLPDVDYIPSATARNVFLLCEDDGSASVVRWVLQHCRDCEFLARFILDYCTVNRYVTSQVLMALLQPEQANSFLFLSKFLQETSGKWLLRVSSLAQHDMRWFLALKFLGSMASPSIGHLHAAFLTFASHCRKPFFVDMDFLWEDDSFSSLQVELSQLSSHVVEGHWEAAVRLLTFGAEQMKICPDLLQRYARAFSHASALHGRLLVEVEAFLSHLKSGVGSKNEHFTAREQLMALVRSKQWVAACFLAARAGSTRRLLELLAHHGRWAESSRLVAAERRAEGVSLVVRAARLAGHWRAALLTVEKAAEEGMYLNYASVAELLACCSLASVPLKGILLWLREQTRGSLAHVMAGLGSSVVSRGGGCTHTMHAEMLFTLLDSSRPVRRQWHCVLQLLTNQMRESNFFPSARLFHTTFSILRKAGRWQESLKLLHLQRSLGIPLTAKAVRPILDALPTAEWQAALISFQNVLESDAGLLCRLMQRLLPQNWECGLSLLNKYDGVVPNTALECVVGCEQVPLHLRLRAWTRLLPLLPVSMRHHAAPVYLRLSFALSNNRAGPVDGIDGMTVIERSIQGLQCGFQNYAAFVYYCAVVHRHWCDATLDPTVGLVAFRSLADIAEKEDGCEITPGMLDHLTDLAERQNGSLDN